MWRDFRSSGQAITSSRVSGPGLNGGWTWAAVGPQLQRGWRTFHDLPKSVVGEGWGPGHFLEIREREREREIGCDVWWNACIWFRLAMENSWRRKGFNKFDFGRVRDEAGHLNLQSLLCLICVAGSFAPLYSFAASSYQDMMTRWDIRQGRGRWRLLASSWQDLGMKWFTVAGARLILETLYRAGHFSLSCPHTCRI